MEWCNYGRLLYKYLNVYTGFLSPPSPFFLTFRLRFLFVPANHGHSSIHNPAPSRVLGSETTRVRGNLGDLQPGDRTKFATSPSLHVSNVHEPILWGLFFFPLKKQKPLIFPFTILGTWGRVLTPAERSAFSFPVSFFSSPEHRDSLPVRFLPPFTHPRLFLPGFFSLLSLRFCEEAAFRIFDMKVVRNEADQNETKQNKKNN